MKLKVKRQRTLTEAEKTNTGVYDWWNQVVSNPRFFHVMETVLSKCKFKAGSIQESMHGQLTSMGHREGYLEFYNNCLNLTPESFTSESEQEYSQDPELINS
jgi:hypothetical protein